MTTPKKSTPAQKSSSKSKAPAKKPAAQSEAVVDLDTLSMKDMRTIEKGTGQKFSELFPEDGGLGIDAVAALVWFAEQKRNPNLTFDEVMDRPFSSLAEMAPPTAAVANVPTTPRGTKS